MSRITHLSAHFTLAEFMVSDTAERARIDNTPPADVIPHLQRTAQGLEAVRIRLGGAPILISSGYRCLELNRRVGSKDSSQHVKGQAADFIVPRFGSPIEIVYALRDSGIDFDQLILEFGRWVHASFTDKPRRECFQIDHGGARPLP
jgi:zinc D-Ala-D-Ala carboxypeptidase